MKKKLFGLIGYPLGHSFSKQYFSDKFIAEGFNNLTYQNFPITDINNLRELIVTQPNLFGLNVTYPYKETIIPFLDKLDETASETGAVNCVKILRKEEEIRTIGFNTDIYGFKSSLLSELKEWHKPALILGTGGSSKAVSFVLRQLGIKYKFVSRNKQAENLNYEDLSLEIIKNHKLIINTTPLGMFPDTDAFPMIPYDGLTSQHFLFDLIYNPDETLFLKFGKENSCTVMNGLEMLHGQADKALEIFRGPLNKD